MQRTKGLALILLFATLVAGGAVGFTVDRVLSHDSCQNPGDHAAMRQYLANRLALTAPQRAAVDSILDVRHQQMSRIIAPVKPQLDSVRDIARAQIMKILDGDQQARFRELLEESRRQEEAENR